ncbi:hypothetical protein ABG980_03995 [Enterococcus casseliflavus]|uniref:hypothetical protein n=1 Tax=Enterococcus casseliflavus TaxID=37734 RepID=UPI0023305B37|nr:hypothetical protein [Enterococcus casseliflavus]MDB1693592.1 hypothetical protein [Enterococcus casseliflavus]MDB1697639.1 hypothetical protein [Enterococcus casseliflavus]MDB1700960.1 hypothetical protein [Enterococcus casseliflavus]MDB1705312.1 hypothetical protein [Enterococcus casseliflavus]
MSKKKGRGWFSAQTLFDEMNQVSLKELKGFEETYEKEKGSAEAAVANGPAKEAFADTSKKKPTNNDQEMTGTSSKPQKGKKQGQRSGQAPAPSPSAQAELEERLEPEGSLKHSTQSWSSETGMPHPSSSSKGKKKRKSTKKCNETVNAPLHGYQEKRSFEAFTAEANGEQLELAPVSPADMSFEQTHQELALARTRITELEKRLHAETLHRSQSDIQQVKEKAIFERLDWAREKQWYESKAQEQKQLLLQKEEVITNLANQLAEKEAELDEQARGTQEEEAAALRKTVNELQKENQELQKENQQFQAEMRDILLFARKKADRTLEEAQVEAERMIYNAEMRLNIAHRTAKEILDEVSDTKENMNTLFDYLYEQVYSLADKQVFEKYQE